MKKRRITLGGCTVLGAAFLLSCQDTRSAKENGDVTTQQPKTASSSGAKNLGVPATAIAKGAVSKRGAIRHRCVLECVWATEYCSDSPACETSMKRCGPGCSNPAALQSSLAAKVSDTWGSTKVEAIEVCLVQGANYFLKDLRCADGKVPRFRRSGSGGPRNPLTKGFQRPDPMARMKKGEADTHVVDLYEVICADKKHDLYLDMYHCGYPKPWAAPRSFSRPVAR